MKMKIVEKPVGILKCGQSELVVFGLAGEGWRIMWAYSDSPDAVRTSAISVGFDKDTGNEILRFRVGRAFARLDDMIPPKKRRTSERHAVFVI